MSTERQGVARLSNLPLDLLASGGKLTRKQLENHLMRQRCALLAQTEAERDVYFTRTRELLNRYVDYAWTYLIASGQTISRERVYERAYEEFLH